MKKLVAPETKYSPDYFTEMARYIQTGGEIGGGTHRSIIYAALRIASRATEEGIAKVLEDARVALENAIYLYDHEKKSDDEAICIREMKAAGRGIVAILKHLSED